MGHEKSLTYSGRELAKRVELAGLPKTLIKCHSLRICCTTSYANSIVTGAATTGFMRFWASEASWDYVHIFEGALEKAGMAVGRESGDKLTISPGLVISYVQGRAPSA